MCWLLFIFYCAISADFLPVGKNGEVLYPEFCKMAVEAVWSAQTQVEVKLSLGNLNADGTTSKFFYFETSTAAKAFMVGLDEFCGMTEDTRIPLRMMPLDHEVIQAEYPGAFASRPYGNTVIIDQIRCNEAGCALHKTYEWNRVEPESD